MKALMPSNLRPLSNRQRHLLCLTLKLMLAGVPEEERRAIIERRLHYYREARKRQRYPYHQREQHP